MNLLLDTHIFIWWDDDYTRLPPALLTALNDPANSIYLSLVSIWEMQIKIQLGKLRFSIPLAQKVRDQRIRNGTQLLPIAEAHIYGLDALPHHHRDPFDRLLIAQANAEKMVLATHDSQFNLYSVTTFWDTPPPI